ncbi:heterokaryon incompatibility protein-domain-containing protein [Coniochaeta sp. 2T2.1]|nr:heterokaryon incompatibility protein-domain-containing protein [Coniochaeta sp. 2T2.1]
MAASAYSYQPLTASDSIRLLVLDPSKDDKTPLHGSLLHTTFADCDYELIEPYTALSYVWGDAAQTDEICISGEDVTITPTLASALRNLRDGTRSRPIWADALCIDQSNLPERNRQVSLMGHIYSLAGNTVIYLGPSSKESDLVLGSAPRSSLGMYPSLDQARRDATIQGAKLDILNRPWFGRVWIFQELILSRDPWVQCGRSRTRWTDLCSLLLYNTPAKGDEKLKMLESMNRSRQGSNAGKMLSLLQARRGLGATDARDFVFAHMGIASDRRKVEGAVPIDYNAPLERVFSRMSLYIVESEGVDALLTLLDKQAEPSKQANMPSWAVDWSRPPSAHAPMYVNNMTSRVSQASYPIVCLEDEGMLGLAGHSVGTIEHLSVPLPWSFTLDVKGMTKYQQTVAKITALYSSTGGVYYTGDSAGRHAQVSLRNHEREHEELCETLFEEWIQVLQGLGPAPADAPDEHTVFLRCFSAWTQQQTARLRVFVTRESTDMLRIMWEYLHPSVAVSSLDGRRLATTPDGNVGVVPAQAQKGDHILNIMGSQASLVLRPVNSSFQVAARVEQRLRAGMRPASPSSTADSRDTGVMHGVPFKPDVAPVKHYAVIGSCCFDGQVPWAVTQLPEDDGKVFICALN